VFTWSDEYDGDDDQSTDDEYNEQRDDNPSPVLALRLTAYKLLHMPER